MTTLLLNNKPKAYPSNALNLNVTIFGKIFTEPADKNIHTSAVEEISLFP